MLTPSSLIDFTPCVNLRSIQWSISTDLVVEQNLSLHLPSLEDLRLSFDPVAWPKVAEVLRAMTSCRPQRLKLCMGPRSSNIDAHGPALENLDQFLSRVHTLEVESWDVNNDEDDDRDDDDEDDDDDTSSDTLADVERLLLQSPMLSNLSIIGIPKLPELLPRLPKTLWLNIRRLTLKDVGEVFGELESLLTYRRDQGVEPMEFVEMSHDMHSFFYFIRLKRLVKTLEWS